MLGMERVQARLPSHAAALRVACVDLTSWQMDLVCPPNLLSSRLTHQDHQRVTWRRSEEPASVVQVGAATLHRVAVAVGPHAQGRLAPTRTPGHRLAGPSLHTALTLARSEA